MRSVCAAFGVPQQRHEDSSLYMLTPQCVQGRPRRRFKIPLIFFGPGLAADAALPAPS
jgi:hypothetical protein